MKKTFKVSPKAVTAAIELDERFDFEFPDKEFECTVVGDKVVNENEVEYTIAIEYPENYWQLEKFLLIGIDEYMHELTDGSDYGFDAIVEEGNPKYFYGSDDMYVYTATVTVYAIDSDLLACNNINSATSITASAWKSPSGKKYGKQTRRFPGSYLFTRKELKQMVDNGDARYIGGNLDKVDSYDVIGFSWNETNGYKSGILVEDRNTGELLVGNTASATIAHF